MPSASGNWASLEAYREPMQRGLAQADFEQRRQLVLLLIDRVIVTDAELEIRYVLPTSPKSEHVRFCHLRNDYFHDPPARRQHEAALGLGQLDHLEGDAVLGGGVGGLFARVALVHEAEFHALTGGVLHGLGSLSTSARSSALAGVTRSANKWPSVSTARWTLEPRLRLAPS